MNLLDLEVTPTFMRKCQPTVLRYDIRMFLRELWKDCICVTLAVVLESFIYDMSRQISELIAPHQLVPQENFRKSGRLH